MTPSFDRSSGRPRSLWDVAFGSVPAGHRAVPGPHGFVLATIVSLHAQDVLGRGRPLRFTLEQAQAIKNAYWNGSATIAQMARDYGVAPLTVSRLVHARTYWYLD